MTLSRRDSNDFFDFHGYINLKIGKYYPSMQLAKLKHIDTKLSADDYAHMDKDTDNYLRPPLRNPMYMDYSAAIQAGISHETLLGFGYLQSDAYQKYLSPDEWELRFETEPYSTAASNARHKLYDFANETDNAFLACFETIRSEMIADWLLAHGIHVE